MSMAERKTVSRAVKNPVKRKLTRAEKKEIAAVIQAAKGDGKPHTAQQTIPYLQMYPDGICRVTEKKYSKSLVFEDINYQLAQADDKTAIFENWCDFLNYFDASVSVQLSFINQGARKEKAQAAIEIPAQDDAFNSIRKEYADMLKNQLEKGNNGLEKCKYITFSIEADNLAAANARLSRIETDVLNNFKVLGVTARPMNGQERLNVLHGIFHPEGEPFRFSWDWLVPSGLSTKDFIAPSSFRFGDGRTFRMGRKLGAVSFLEILAPELNDRMLSDILDLENGIIVNLHIRSIDQSEAIKTIKRKITDLDKMKIEEQKKAVRSAGMVLRISGSSLTLPITRTFSCISPKYIIPANWAIITLTNPAWCKCPLNGKTALTLSPLDETPPRRKKAALRNTATLWKAATHGRNTLRGAMCRRTTAL